MLDQNTFFLIAGVFTLIVSGFIIWYLDPDRHNKELLKRWSTLNTFRGHSKAMTNTALVIVKNDPNPKQTIEKVIYEIIADSDDAAIPPEGHHWEGHTAKRIVNALNLGVEQSDLILKVMELEQENKKLNKYLTTKEKIEKFHQSDMDSVYKERNTLVALLARIYPSGIKKTAIEGWSPEWHNCVYIELPDGSQCSWHYHNRDSYLFEGLPPYEKEWDGHTTENKYFNIEQLILSGSLKK